MLPVTDKIPEKTNIKKEKFVLAHGLKGFSPLSLDSATSRLVMEHNIMVGSDCNESAHRVEAERPRNWEQQPDSTLKGIPSVSFQLSHTSKSIQHELVNESISILEISCCWAL